MHVNCMSITVYKFHKLKLILRVVLYKELEVLSMAIFLREKYLEYR